MFTKRMNVLVYSGTGSTVESVRHCLFSLRQLLAPNYAVIPVTGDMLIKEPWTATCAAVVFPGGADLGYCRILNGEGNRRIRQFVERGGVYIGFCAGGYYGTSRCEFEVGNKQLEVIGDRELGFYPGTCRGCAFPGFVYNSEKGARAAELKVNKTVLSTGSVPNVFRTYYNGGGVFVDAPMYRDRGVEVLASYTEKIAVDAGEGAAAVVYCKVGQGAALLTGPHPEHAAIDVDKKKAEYPEFEQVAEVLAHDEKHRVDFLKACLTKLGLQVSQEQKVPPLSRLHLSSVNPTMTKEVMSSLAEIITSEDDEEYIRDDNDTFRIVKPSAWKMLSLKEALPSESSEQTDQFGGSTTSDRIVDYNTIVKQVLVHDDDHPATEQTPYFNHDAFYDSLQHHRSTNTPTSSSPYASAPLATFGSHMLYGEVVTSTNTMLEKNTHMLRRLPNGFTATATTQVAGRGRGSNIWIAPAGSLLFSTVIRHPMSLMTQAPVVFVQYLAAMAVVDGIKSYSPPTEQGHRKKSNKNNNIYANLPVKLKWPNDIYALAPGRNTSEGPEAYTKIGGILVNSHYNASEYIMVVGVGLNVSNAAPTTSLNALLPKSTTTTKSTSNNNNSNPSTPNTNTTTSTYPTSNPTTISPLSTTATEPITLEALLPAILSSFENLYTRFLRTGFDATLEAHYYAQWLHTDQVVTLETQGGARARIKGITRDYGLLVAEELDTTHSGHGGGHGDGRPTGRRWELQSDSNSFDFFKGLLKRKQM